MTETTNTAPALAYRPKEARERIGVSKSTFAEWIRTGKIASTKIGGVRLIPASAVEKILTGAN